MGERRGDIRSNSKHRSRDRLAVIENELGSGGNAPASGHDQQNPKVSGVSQVEYTVVK